MKAPMTRNRYMVGLVFLVFFVMSLVTNFLGPIIPDIIRDFRVSLAVAAFLNFFFFIAYSVVSIPAGFWMEKYSEKPVMITAFLAASIGALSFALFPSYSVALGSLFVMGAGMATLQVAVNPLLRVSGGEEHFAFNSAFAQLIFCLGSFISPRIYSYLVESLANRSQADNLIVRGLGRLTPPELPWASMYWIFAVATVVMMVVLAFTRFPKIERKDDERAGSWQMYGELLRKPIVWLFFLSVFAYVGCEQGTANWMSEFLARYHGFDPHTTGATAVSSFWGLMTTGCFIGMGLLKIFDSRKVLIAFTFLALFCLSAALFGSAQVALYAFPTVGLFASIMWPVLVSLALNSVSEHHGPFAGILSTGIMGGGVVPVIIGRIGDHFGLRTGLCFLYVTFGCVLTVGFWAKPIITNATIFSHSDSA
jgi:FHS family L-fucose permease-like MFS transporter